MFLYFLKHYRPAYGRLKGIAVKGIAAQLQIGVGRGAAAVVIAAGILLCLTALILSQIKSVTALEDCHVEKTDME